MNAIIVRIIGLLFASGVVAALILRDWKIIAIPMSVTIYIFLAVGIATVLGGGP